tara:strand:- start:1298 stop:1807 length:510 start_codon:yes stop_codon:yes gene_type:complete
MNKIQTLRVANNIILGLSIIGYLILWKDINKGIEALDKFGLMNFATYITANFIESVIISIFIWLFISSFCENAEDTKEVLSLLKDRNIHKKDDIQKKNRKEEIEITNTIDKDEIIEIEKMKQTINTNDLIVKVKKSGKIEKIKKADWDEIVKLGNENKFEIRYRRWMKK